MDWRICLKNKTRRPNFMVHIFPIPMAISGTLGARNLLRTRRLMVSPRNKWQLNRGYSMIGGLYIFICFHIFSVSIYIYIFPYFACNPGNLIAFYKSSYLTAVNHRDKRAIFQSYVSLFFGVSIIGRLYPQFHIFPWDRYYIIFPSIILYYISIYFHGVYSLYIYYVFPHLFMG